MIVGFSVKSISAERKKKPKGRVNINSRPKILSVNEAEKSFLKGKTPLDVEFEFVTKYEPKVGEIKIYGDVFYMGKKMKDTLKSWKKEKKLPKGVDVEIKNFLFRKCLTIGMNLSEDMHLPPPLVFPRIVPKKKVDLRYIG